MSVIVKASMNRIGKGQSVESPFTKGLHRLFWVIPAFVSLFLLLFALSDVAGLHRDEAAFGLFAEQIQEGLRPVRGLFNEYTSPIHSYIIAIFFGIFGESIWTLRVNGILLNLFAVAFYADVIRRIVPDKALWTLWFLITLPAFVVMARISGENYALNPFFLFGGIWGFHVLGVKGPSRWVSRAGFLMTGLFFSLGVWNHAVFIPTMGGLIVVYLLAARPGMKEIKVILPWLLLGALIGALPKAYGALALGYSWAPSSPRAGVPPFSEALLNMVYTLGGDALYIRACGKVLFSLQWFLPFCTVASAGIFLNAAIPGRQKRLWIAAASWMAVSFVGTWLITPPGLVGSRLWLLPLWVTPLLISLSLPLSPRWLKLSLGGLVIIVNLAGLGVNYFYNFLQDGGLPKGRVYVGGRFDNSWDFIDMRPLVEKAGSYNDKPIYIEDYNTFRLRFLLPKGERHRARTVQAAITGKEAIPAHSLAALYRLEKRKVPSRIDFGGNLGVKNPQLSTDHYEVFEIVETRKP